MQPKSERYHWFRYIGRGRDGNDHTSSSCDDGGCTIGCRAVCGCASSSVVASNVSSWGVVMLRGEPWQCSASASHGEEVVPMVVVVLLLW